MSYSLSFTEEFFTGDGSCELHEIAPSKRPTNVYQAALSLPHKRLIEIARYVFGYDPRTAEFWANGESFPGDIVNKIRETDTCSDLSPPVRAWIDPEGYHTLDIFETREQADEWAAALEEYEDMDTRSKYGNP